LRAALIHLIASVGVAILAAAVIFTLWYPWPYRTVSGGTELFLLIVLIDASIGPLMTLVIFDRRKPLIELRRDIAIVVMIQLGALVYGMHTTFIARPVVLALEGGRFRAVQALAVVDAELPGAPPSLRHLSVSGPRIVRTVVPEGGNARLDAITLALAGVDLGMRPKFWREWDAEGRKEALAMALPLAHLASERGGLPSKLNAAVERTKSRIESLAYLPLLARLTNWIVLLDAHNGEIVGFAPLDDT
jgi:hypothetical protein